MAYQPQIYGVVSLINSSVANIAANGNLTTAGEDVSTYSNVKVNIFTSHVGALDGLQIQQSPNNIDWDPTDVYTIPATTKRSFSVPVNEKFLRIVYTNGATLTTSFRLQVVYHTNDKQPSSVRPQDARSNDNDFVEVLSSLMGYNGTAWDRLRSTIAKGLDVNPTELRAATLAVTTTAASGTAATLTIPAVAGLFHYITALDIVLYSAAARTGSAAPTVVTTTNLPGAIAFTFSTAGAIGTTDVQDLIRTTPLKSSIVNTNTTIVCPIAAGGIWRITATYFTGV